MDQLVSDRSSQQILTLLKPEVTTTEDNDPKILGDLSFGGGRFLSVKISGTERTEITLVSGGFDSGNRLHGNAELRIPGKDRINFGFVFDDVIAVKGRFSHGQLSGIVVLELQDLRRVFLTVRNSVAHGPAVIAGFVPILPVMCIPVSNGGHTKKLFGFLFYL